MSVSVEAWVGTNTSLSPAEIDCARDMADNVALNALGFLMGEKESFNGLFQVDVPLHEKAKDLFLPQLQSLDEFVPDGDITVSEESWNEFVTRGEGRKKHDVEIEHTLIKFRQVVANSSGRMIVAEVIEWLNGDLPTGALPICQPSMVRYFGVRTDQSS